MAYSKPQVTIDLEEYQELLEKAESAVNHSDLQHGRKVKMTFNHGESEVFSVFGVDENDKAVFCTLHGSEMGRVDLIIYKPE